jgi:hypothetical protein
MFLQELFEVAKKLQKGVIYMYAYNGHMSFPWHFYIRLCPDKFLASSLSLRLPDVLVGGGPKGDSADKKPRSR